jgi:hypothetical protein
MSSASSSGVSKSKSKRSEAGTIECARNKLITRTVPATPAAVRKQDERLRIVRNRKATREQCAPSGNVYFSHDKQNRDLFRFTWEVAPCEI